MSEADSLDRNSPESILQRETLTGIPAASSATMSSATDAWQTVDCPGAISIDAIPTDTASDAIGAAAPEPAHQLMQLRQENLALRDRVTQLEQDFTQEQIKWQLETTRLLHQVVESTTPEQAQAVQSQLTTAQEQLSRVFQELELSHQTAQRQQILVETLTEQLESGQERIAELERDCATTQQRYNEEVQQRLQADAACRDLRIRLNRQQQHTLQFKVALEKCLEMPGPSGRSLPELDLSHAPAESISAESIVAVNSPVQPWSAPINPLHVKPSLSHLLQPDSPTASAELKVLKPSIVPISEPGAVNYAAPNEGDRMNQSFRGSEPPVAASDSSPSSFDLQPLLGEAGAPALSTQIQQASDTLWQDLTALIDPAIPAERDSEPEPQVLESLESAVSEVSDLHSFPELGSVAVPPSLPRSLISGSPSPVVYPQRPIKKRESLAAVELPTFPRKRQ